MKIIIFCWCNFLLRPYLDAENLIKVALREGCQAVHPGAVFWMPIELKKTTKDTKRGEDIFWGLAVHAVHVQGVLFRPLLKIILFFFSLFFVGYGFLSENEAFVSLCEKHGVKFPGCKAESGNIPLFSSLALTPQVCWPILQHHWLVWRQDQGVPSTKKKQLEPHRIRTSKICRTGRYIWFFDQRPVLKSAFK